MASIGDSGVRQWFSIWTAFCDEGLQSICFPGETPLSDATIAASFHSPIGVGVDSAGMHNVSDYWAHRIQVFEPVY